MVSAEWYSPLTVLHWMYQREYEMTYVGYPIASVPSISHMSIAGAVIAKAIDQGGWIQAPTATMWEYSYNL